MKEHFVVVKSKIHAFLTWQWVKRFLYWLVVSAGTVSECVFLVASLWVSLNATVHPLMLQFMSQNTTLTFSQMAVSAFTALPEIILGLAVVATYGHIKFFAIHRRKSALVWAILFGLPTVVFASLTIWTLASSSLQIGYVMPAFLVAMRVLAGYAYGFLSMLFVLIGEPDIADYVGGLKGNIERLSQEIDSLKIAFAQEIGELKATYSQEKQTLAASYSIEIEKLTDILKTQNEQVNLLAERASSLNRDALELYPKVQIEWIEKGRKTVSIEEIEQVTGLSKQKISGAIRSGKLVKDNRNKELIRVSSVVEWLRSIPVEKTTNSGPLPFAKAEQNTDPLPVQNGHSNGRKNTRPLSLDGLVVMEV